jgi:hypothetical protein
MTALSSKEHSELLVLLETRFHHHQHRHANITWQQVVDRLKAHPEKIKALQAMENSGGEPDVVALNTDGALVFMDCSTESPKRRSVSYDKAALDARKENKPADSAMNMASQMGVELLDETQYRYLQSLEAFDLKTSSWIKTPDNIRKLGGALFGDRRYDTVFIYHNGAESYYAARGFRTSLII